MAKESTASGAPGSPAAGSASAPAGKAVRQAADSLVRRMPPFNEEAEQGVLAGLLNYPDVTDDIFSILQQDDFYLPKNGLIFETCNELYQAGAPLAPQTVAEKLLSKNQLEAAGGNEYLSNVFSQQVLGVSAVFFARMVRNKSMQRKLINTCAHIMSSTYDTPYDRVEGLLDDAEHSIFAIAENSASDKDLRSVGELRDAFFNRLETTYKNPSALTGVTTGYTDIDRMTGGLQPSDLIIVAARPSMGKTAFALNIALNAAHAGRKVAFFSLEMSADQLESRLMAICAKVPLSRIRQPRYLQDADWKTLYAASDKLDCPLYIDDTPALKTMELRAKARRMKARTGLDLVMVDYLQLMRPSRPMSARELEISEISRTLKSLAKELDLPVVALSQLNRKLEERNDKRPMLSDLRESGAIEQDADVIMFLYREDMYARRRKPGEEGEAGQPVQRSVNSPTEIILGKQRNGPVGTVNLLYQCEYTAFQNLDERWDPSPAENGVLQ